MITEYYIEVPGTNIKESVSGFAYDTLYDMAQQYGCLLYTSDAADE